MNPIHADVSTTLNVYTQVVEESQSKRSREGRRIFGPKWTQVWETGTTQFGDDQLNQALEQMVVSRPGLEPGTR